MLSDEKKIKEVQDILDGLRAMRKMRNQVSQWSSKPPARAMRVQIPSSAPVFVVLKGGEPFFQE